jgi:phosphoglucomutase
MDYNEKYIFWRNNAYFDTVTKNELDDIKDDSEEIKQRFEKELEFGTGGLRGIIGAGTNRMNVYVVRRASQGVAAHIASEGAQRQGVVIGYDSRNQSSLFAAEAARVFAGNDIPVYLFNGPRPTPMLSFAIRRLNAAAGVMITASHNPKEYNGYKVYGEDGAQLSDTGAVADEIARIDDITRVRLLDGDAAIEAGLVHVLGKELDDAYVSCVRAFSAGGDIVKAYAERVKIVFTPLHGVGGEIVSRVLREEGFGDLHIVESQYAPDENFPTLNKTLNPEDREVYGQALALAKEKDADIILATDPDCDRVGVMVKSRKNRYVFLTGNEAGALMLDYILSASGERAEGGFVAKTIVTTRLTDSIARHYGVRVEEVLTGFKYIGALIAALHDTGGKRFIFGMEDSCGYLVGTDVRDKDGVIGCMLIAEAAAWYKSQGMPMYEGLKRLFARYGWFSGELMAYPVCGDGIASRVQSLLSDTDGACFRALGVTAVRNYSLRSRYDLESGESSALSLPKSDVVFYELKDGWLCIRPSGTESKVKIYVEVRGKNRSAADRRLKRIKKYIIKQLT